MNSGNENEWTFRRGSQVTEVGEQRLEVWYWLGPVDRRPQLEILSLTHERLALFLACVMCTLPSVGCAPSKHQETIQHQPILENVQQQASAQVAPVPATTPDTQKCPNFRGQFMYPGNNPVTIEQTGCNEIVERLPDGHTVIHLVLDGSQQAIQGADGRYIIRRSIWNGSTVQTEEKVYLKNGDWTAMGVVLMALNPRGDIVLHRDASRIVEGKEVAGPPKADYVAERISDSAAPGHR